MRKRKTLSARSLLSLIRSARPGLETLEDRIVLSGGATTPPLPQPTGVSISSTSYSSNDILVKYRTNQPQAVLSGTSIGQQLSLVNNLYEVNLSRGVTVTQALAAYSAAPSVLTASPDYILSTAAVPNNPDFTQQWALQNTGQNGGTAGDDIGATQAWNYTTGSNSI